MKEMEPLGKPDPLYYKVEASLPFDEVIQILEAPAQKEVSTVSSLSKILMILYFMIWKVKRC
jgi:hypothetical protein